MLKMAIVVGGVVIALFAMFIANNNYDDGQNNNQTELVQNPAICRWYVDNKYADYTNHTDIVQQCITMGLERFDEYTKLRDTSK